MRRVPTDDLSARVRAAFAFAGLKKAERAAALGVSARTVTRIESGEVDVDTDRLEAISLSTGVPESFLRHGFHKEEPGLGERVEALENRNAALQDSVTQLRSRLETGLAASAGGMAQLQRELRELRDRDRSRPHAAADG